SRPQAGKPLPNRHGLVVSVVTLAVPVVTNPSLGGAGALTGPTALPNALERGLIFSPFPRVLRAKLMI
ncbi:MAG: hypothetical protein VXZ43_00600, partial [Pseudomonadota bacterium]|nr:hypothetical protein [Pseudomonadota bacterium]